MDLHALTTQEYALQWGVMLVLFLMLLWKYVPEIRNRLNSWRKKENAEESVASATQQNTEQIKNLKKQAFTNEARIDSLESFIVSEKEYRTKQAAEQKLIINALFAIIKGLEEQGCDGPVHEAHEEIERFLIDQAH